MSRPLPVFHPTAAIRDGSGNFLLLDKKSSVFIESYNVLSTNGEKPIYQAKGKLYKSLIPSTKITCESFFLKLKDAATRENFSFLMYALAENKTIKVPKFLTVGIPLKRILQGAFLNLLITMFTLGFMGYSISGYMILYLMPGWLYLMDTGKDIEFMFTEDVFKMVERVGDVKFRVADFAELREKFIEITGSGKISSEDRETSGENNPSDDVGH